MSILIRSGYRRQSSPAAHSRPKIVEPCPESQLSLGIDDMSQMGRIGHLLVSGEIRTSGSGWKVDDLDHRPRF
jgi:hypothetical protein